MIIRWKQIWKDTLRALGNFLSMFRPKKKGGWIDSNKDGIKTRFEVLFRDAVYCTIRKNKKGKSPSMASGFANIPENPFAITLWLTLTILFLENMPKTTKLDCGPKAITYF